MTDHGPDLSKLDVPSLPHRRRLNAEEQRYMANLCSKVFNSEIDPKVIEKIMNYVNFVEKKMIGRMASHVEDLIIHYLMRYFSSLPGTPGAHMEIGTLFGGTVLLAHHAVHLAEKSLPIHVIDPFEGYYGKGKDIITGEDVSEENFLKNLNSLGVPREEVVIHKGFSTDQKVIGECRSLKLLSLLIDGDHSYDGVKNDWINFAHLVVPGGYVLIDNYNDQYWPDVMSYMNNEVLSNLRGRWEIAVVYANSLLLRRTSQQEDKDLSDAQRLFHELKEKEEKYNVLNALTQAIEKGHKEDTEKLLSSFKGSKEPIERLIEKIETLERNHRAETERVLQFKSDAENLQAEMKKLEDVRRAEVAKLQKEKSEVEARVKELEKGKAKVEAEVKELEKGKAELRASVEQLHREKTEVKAEVEQLQTEMKKLADTYKAEAERFKREQANIQTKIVQLQTEVRKKDEQYSADVEKLATDINSLIEDGKSKDEYIDQLVKSLSWKVTAPLRALSKPFAGKKGKQD